MEQAKKRDAVLTTHAESELRGLWASIAGNGLARAGGAAILVMLQLYQARIGVSPEFVGLVGVAFYLTELTLAPVFGAMVDRRGWRPFMLLGPVLSAVAAVLTWLTTFVALTLALPILFITRLLNGVGIASNVPATLSYLSAASGDDAALRARAVGYFELATIGGTALGGLLGAQLFRWFGDAGFLVLAAFYLVSWGVYRLVPAQLPGKPTVRADAHPNPLHLFRIKALWTFAPAWVVVNGVLGIWLNNFANQLTLSCAAPPNARIARLCARIGEQFLVGNFSPTTAGAIFTGFAVFFCIGIMLWIRVLPRMRQTQAMLISLGGSVVTCGLVLAINRLHDDRAAPVVLVALVVLVAIALMVLSGFTPAALGILVELAERNATDRGTIMGAYSVLLGIGQFIGGAVGGFFAGWLGVNGLTLLTLLFTLIAGVFVLIYRRSEPAPGRVTP